MTWIKNIKIINYDKIIINADVEIENDIIKTIIEKEGEGASLLVPGFIDTHIHGSGGFDVMDGVGALEKITKALAKAGTTSFLPTIMTSPWDLYIQSIQEAIQINTGYTKILGLHLEGPFISKHKKGAHEERYILKPLVSQVKYLQDLAQGKVKKMTFAPEEAEQGYVEELLKYGISPSIGHTNAPFKVVSEAIKQGANSGTHLWNAMTGVQNREPGVAEAILNSRDVYAELICDFVHVDPETIKLSINSKGIDRVIVITDAIRPAGLPNGVYESGGQRVTKNGYHITLEGTNTMAGSGATLFDNFRNLYNLGYGLTDLVALTSYNATQHFKFDQLLGQIRVGYKADLVQIDRSIGKVEKVWIDGKEIH